MKVVLQQKAVILYTVLKAQVCCISHAGEGYLEPKM